MADEKNTEREKQMNELLRVSPQVAAILNSISSHKEIRDLAGRIQEMNSRLPKIDPAIAALLSNPIPKELEQSLAVAARIQSNLPKLAPEFIESVNRIQAMTEKITASPEVRALIAAMQPNSGLLEAARAASVFAPTSGKTLRDHLLADQWPVMQSFRYQDEDVLMAEIDLTEVEKDDSSEKPSGLFLEESQRVKRIITDIYQNDATLLQLESRTFEEVIAELLRSQGFTVELTKQTRDGGYDIIALSHSQGGFPLKFLVECKRYTTEKIGIEVVRNLMYVVQEKQANKGIIAATTFFTREAKQQRDSIHPYQLDLRDKSDVLKWIRQYGEKHLHLPTGGA